MKPSNRRNACAYYPLIVLGTVLPLTGLAAQADASAEAEGFEIEKIVVTATRLPRPIKDIAGTVTVITDVDLERQLTVDLDDLVRYQPGITMNTAGRGGNQGFVIRGIGGNRVLTLLDGIRSSDIYSAGPASYGKDTFEVDDLKVAEIVRGPASVLYGADAMGGAVVLQTKDPDDYTVPAGLAYLGAQAGYASADEQLKTGITGATQQGDWGFLLRYTYRDFEERDVAGDAEANPQDGSSNNLLIKTVWTPNDDHRLKLTLDAALEEIDYVLLTDLSGSVTESIGMDETDRYRISFDHEWQLQTAIADFVNSQLYWQTTDGLQHTEQMRMSFSFINPFDPSTYGGTPAERVTDFEFNQEILGAQMMLSKDTTWGGSEHSIVYGFGIDQTDTERPRNRCETEVSDGDVTCDIAAFPFAPPEEFPNKTFPDTETRRAGVYLQDEIALGDSGLAIIPGVRYDYYKMDPAIDGSLPVAPFGFDVVPVSENEASFNLGVIYDLTEDVALFAQYAEGFRPPNVDEANQAFVNYGFGYATVPNPELRPETSQGIEIGVKATLPSAYLSLALYDNRYEDFIDSQFIGVDSGISLFQDRNIGEARIYGAEASAVWSLSDRWQVSGAVAWSHGDDEEADVPLDSIEPLTGVVGLRFSAPDDRWGIESVLTLVDKKDRVSADDRVTAAGYGLLDLIGHFNMTDNASIRLGVFNVTDEKYARWANIQGLAASAVDSIALAQEPGTNFRANVNVQF